MSKSKSIAQDILEQAADWLVLLHSGQMTEQQHQQFSQWKAAHPDHQSAITRVEKLTSGFSKLPKNINQNTLFNANRQLSSKIAKKLLLVFTPIFVFATAYQYLPWQKWQADATSKVGEVKKLTLADGSLLTLASDSAVNIHFDDQKREIELIEGEIYVETAKDAHSTYRPFIIDTYSGTIQALGTQFSVRQHKKSQDTHVTVYQHAVAIRPMQNHSKTTLIQQGEQAQFDEYTVYRKQKLVQQQPYWTQQLLVVENQPLEQVLTEIYRYQQGQFFISDAAKQIKVSGVYNLKHPKQSIEALAETYDLQLNYYTDYILYVKK